MSDDSPAVWRWRHIHRGPVGEWTHEPNLKSVVRAAAPRAAVVQHHNESRGWYRHHETVDAVPAELEGQQSFL